MRPAVLFFFVQLCSTACDGSYPRDPEHTTERVSSDRRVRVGVTEHAPWVVHARGGGAEGAEAALVEQFAKTQGAQVEWYWGQQEALLHALKEFRLDLVVGGLRKETLFSEHVGLTKPWHVVEFGVGPVPIPPAHQQQIIGPELERQALVIATPPGENRWLGELTRFLEREQAALEQLAAEAWR